MRDFMTLVENAQSEDGAPAPRLIILGKNGAQAQQDAFMADYQAATHDHPMDHTSRLTSDAVIKVRPFGRAIHINDILSLSPGQGGGRKALEFICQLADKHNLKLTLTALNYGHPERLSTGDLRKWYERYGFVVDDDEDGERYPNASDEDGYDMTRWPKS